MQLPRMADRKWQQAALQADSCDRWSSSLTKLWRQPCSAPIFMLASRSVWAGKAWRTASLVPPPGVSSKLTVMTRRNFPSESPPAWRAKSSWNSAGFSSTGAEPTSFALDHLEIDLVSHALRTLPGGRMLRFGSAFPHQFTRRVELANEDHVAWRREINLHGTGHFDFSFAATMALSMRRARPAFGTDRHPHLALHRPEGQGKAKPLSTTLTRGCLPPPSASRTSGGTSMPVVLPNWRSVVVNFTPCWPCAPPCVPRPRWCFPRSGV